MRRRRDLAPVDGWVALYKERGLSSFQASEQVRRMVSAPKAGHGGTLDPFAEGVLPVALGGATKTLGLVLSGDKSYRAWVSFGRETDSGDDTGETVAEVGGFPGEGALVAELGRLRGEVEQIPPALSAIKLGGRRACDRVRAGELVVMAPRLVVIHDVTLESYEDGVACVVVRCGKGTYLRALARDWGRSLGCGAHLTRLVRIETLGFVLSDTVTVAELEAQVRDGNRAEWLYPLDRVLDDIPALRVAGETLRRLACGQAVELDHGSWETPGEVRMVSVDGTCVGIGAVTLPMGVGGRYLLSPKRWFQTA